MIPAAFLFRWLAAQSLDDTEAIEIVGKYSLFAFGLGIITCWIGWSLIGWVGRRRYFTTQLDLLEAQTAELDHTGITVIRKGARSTYEWIRIPRCTLERSLLLVWITPHGGGDPEPLLWQRRRMQDGDGICRREIIRRARPRRATGHRAGIGIYLKASSPRALILRTASVKARATGSRISGPVDATSSAGVWKKR